MYKKCEHMPQTCASNITPAEISACENMVIYAMHQRMREYGELCYAPLHARNNGCGLREGWAREVEECNCGRGRLRRWRMLDIGPDACARKRNNQRTASQTRKTPQLPQQKELGQPPKRIQGNKERQESNILNIDRIIMLMTTVATTHETRL